MISNRTKNVLDFSNPTPYTSNITPTMEINMNKRQYKKLLAKRASITFTTAQLMGFSKQKLLALGAERKVTVRKSWNKTKITSAIIANQ
tara:strand:+ start:7203 stop:7469 length:267 start_codon:yes stop_codon:yes gene_type:complete